MVVQPLQRFLLTEAAGGIVLMAAAAVALIWANSPWSASYRHLFHTQVALRIGSAGITEDLQHWINDLAMALFFFVAALEIKREFVHGQLRSARVATLPVACALGGMVVPAALYWSFNVGTPTARGWGIPMATDIAFALGVLALVGRRVPAALRVFLLTMAIVDDLGAILVIAVFYTDHLAFTWLVGAAAVVLVIVALARVGVRSLVPYVLLGAALWMALFESGVHATLAGVVLGLLTPARPFQHPRTVRRAATKRLEDLAPPDASPDEDQEATFLAVAELNREAVSPLARLERACHPWSSYVVLPTFALANAGIVLTAGRLSAAWSSPVTRGVVVGLVVGKPIGILITAWLAVRLARSTLPPGVGWLEMVGVSVLAGVGFTVSLFVTGLAFSGPHAAQAEIGILAASVLAGSGGAALLASRATPDPLVH